MSHVSMLYMSILLKHVLDFMFDEGNLFIFGVHTDKLAIT